MIINNIQMKIQYNGINMLAAAQQSNNNLLFMENS